ncbi:MAG: XRE family transcriptional regulator [Desulfuromonadales bacterium]
MVKKIIGKKLKATRLRNDMTIQGLAECSGVSSNMISRIERGLTTPSVEIIVKLANAFGMSINYFVEEAFFEDKHQIISLTQGLRDPNFTVFYDTIEKDCNSGEGGMVHTGEEFALILEGALEFVIEGENYQLEEGDSIVFKASLPHRWRNLHPGKTLVLWVVSPAPSLN